MVLAGMSEQLTIREAFNLLNQGMIDQFEKHNDKYHDFSMDGLFDNLKGIDLDTLRYELDMHYAKMKYLGIHKQTMPEEDTVINLVNVGFLLYIRLLQHYGRIDLSRKELMK